MKIPGADGVLDWFEQRVLADPLRAAEHECMVNLLARTLRSMREPRNDMGGVIRIEHADVIEPRAGFGGVVARLDPRRPVLVERGCALALNPTTHDD